MTAALLREAAQMLREKAEAATPGPWRLNDWSGVMVETASPPNRGAAMIADADDEPVNAEFIALADPTVALAVADLLDGWADDIAQHGGSHRSDERALTVARAVLRRES